MRMYTIYEYTHTEEVGLNAGIVTSSDLLCILFSVLTLQQPYASNKSKDSVSDSL